MQARVAAYDRLRAEVDVLVMWTTPMKVPLAGPPLDELGLITGSSDAILNTAAFDVTDHPALSVRCGGRLADRDHDGRPALRRAARRGRLRAAARVTASRPLRRPAPPCEKSF